MWCDNCLLSMSASFSWGTLAGETDLLLLCTDSISASLVGHGAIAWDVFIAIYSLAGGIFLFRYGQYLFFNYPEWSLYAAVSWVTTGIALINVIGLSNSNYLWSRVCFFLWPFDLVVVAVRAGFMMFQLNRQQGKIIWECNNGGQLWGQSAADGYDNGAAMPSGICSSGFHSLYTAFVLSLLIDFGMQVYAYFLCWRFMKRIEHYYRLATSEFKPYLG